MSLIQKIKDKVYKNRDTIKTAGKVLGGALVTGGLAYGGYKAYKAFAGKKKKSRSTTSSLRSKLKRVRTKIQLIRAQRTLEKEIMRI